MTQHDYTRPLMARAAGRFDYKVEDIVVKLRETGRTIFDLDAIYLATTSLYPEHQTEDNMMFIVEDIADEVREALIGQGCQIT